MGKYFNFGGTASRSEFWAVAIISWVVYAIAVCIGIAFYMGGTPGVVVGSLIILVSLVAFLWLTIATTMRRCRSADLNPWWTAACFVPYIGWIVYIVIGCLAPKA